MKLILGLLLGFAAGVVVGLLLAPQPGETTRAQISEQRDNLTEQVRSRANSLSGDLRIRANDAVSQGREVYNRTKGELSERYTQAKSGNLS
jgi:gas vesicle protein